MTTDPDPDFREPHLRQDDFLGAFAVIEDARGILMVENDRVIDGRAVRVWDLPGGQVEPGERLDEALVRELAEEVAIGVRGADARFLFLQEGERVLSGRRAFAWRSFFFAVAAWKGEPAATGEVHDCRFVPRAELATVLTAPYHDSFAAWVVDGGRFFSSRWVD